MADTIGPITVPEVTPVGTFPLVSRWPHGRAQRRAVVTHRFGAAAGNGKIEQRYFVGDGAMRFRCQWPALKDVDRLALRDFWDARKGGYGSFAYAAPLEDGSFETHTVCFEDEPLSVEHLSDAVCSTGVTLVDIPDPAGAPVYSVSSTVTRFPGSGLNTALLAQEQEIVPLVRIRVLDGGIADIFLSDRRVTVGGQLYLPRLLYIGEKGSDVLISQSIDGSTDQAQFVFGNADRVMTQLAAATKLGEARIELSFFHVGTLTKIDFWAGKILDWRSDAGVEFPVRATDPLGEGDLALQGPAGTCGRDCARRFKLDGCPFDPLSDTRDLVNFPTASLTVCDFGYNTPNGCLAHGVQHAYKAVYASPQTVNILDNGTGTLGFGRANLSATSEIADSVFGQAVPEIWHDDDGNAARGLPVNALLAAGREESDFYIGLGVVGAGPLDGFTAPQMVDTDGDGKKETFVGSTLDGQPHHGLKVDVNGNPATGNSSLGLRQVVGNDPAGSTDYFSLGRVASSARGWYAQASDGSLMHEVIGGGSAYNEVFAAAVAFCELRRSDPKGVQLSLPGEHQMRVMIAGGLTGWAWSAPGSRSSAGRLTNPVWVAVNSYLRWRSLNGASAGTQEQYVDVTAAAAAAAIADTVVSPIFGSGTEKQFRFKGVVSERRPARDWLRDILNNTVGFFRFDFGRLVIGLRINASVESAFTAGNMLFDSLAVTPRVPRFEKLTVEFADEEYLYRKNTVEYLDKDYAAAAGRVQNPREMRIGLVGSSTKSQAARFAIVRAREELGGVNAAEQAAAVTATWGTTLLALETYPGQVVSVTDADQWTGARKFRIQRHSLMRDYSIAVQGDPVTDSMYDMTVGPKPADVQAAPLPTEAPRDANKPPAPSFGVEVSDLDSTVAEVTGVAFADPTNTHTITAGTFSFYYVDPASADFVLGADVASGDSHITLASAPGTDLDGKFVEIGAEIVKCGTASGVTVPVTRAQLGTSAATALTGDSVLPVLLKVATVAWAPDFFATPAPEAATWALLRAFPDQKLVAVAGFVTNAYGDGAATVVCLTGNMTHGLVLTAPAAGVSADRVVNVTNTASTTLTAGSQIVNVVATTVDCGLTLPPASSMVGLDVKVNLSPGSTKNAVVAPTSGDTIQGSSSSYTISTAGSSVTFESDGADLKIVASAGSVSAVSYPDAPNVTSVTATAVYALLDNASAYGFTGQVALPSSRDHLKKIHILGFVGSNPGVLLAELLGPWASTPVDWNSGPDVRFLMSAASTLAWTIKAYCENEDGVVTAAPASVGVTVARSQVTAVTASEASSSAWTVDDATRLVSTQVDFVATLSAAVVPQNVNYYLSEDGGANFRWINWEKMTAVGQTISFKRLKPGTAQTWKVACKAGAIGGNPSTLIPSASFAAGEMSSGFTVSALALPGAGLITGLSIAAGAGPVSNPYNVFDPDQKRQYWLIPGWNYTDPSGAKDAFFVRVTVEDRKADGSSNGPEKAFAGDQVRGGTRSIGVLVGPYSDTTAKIRFRIYVCNRVDQTENSFANSLCATLQTSAWGGADHLDVTIGTTPPAAGDAARMATGFGPGIFFDPGSSTWRLQTAGSVPSVSPLSNSDFESGLAGWTVAGSGVTASSSSPHGGSGCAKVASSSGGLKQVAACQPGKQVALSAWMRGDAVTNLIPNPGFESGISDYDYSGPTLDTTVSHSGSNSAKFSAAGGYLVALEGIVGAHSAATAPGRSATFSAWFKSSASPANGMFLLMRFLDSTGASIGVGDYANSIASSSGGWTQVSVTATAPAGAAFVKCYMQPVGALGGSDFWWVDDLAWSDGMNTDGTAKVGLVFRDSGGAAIGSPSLSGGIAANTTTWAQTSVSVAAPAGTSTVEIWGIYTGSGLTRGAWNVDDAACSITTPTAGAGVKVDAFGNAIIGESSTVGVDGSGNAKINNSSLTNALIVPGEIGADLSRWLSSARPWGFYFGLPSPSGSNVPDIAINTAETPWRIYNKVSGSWVVQSTRPGDLIAGTIAALVGIISPVISGGSLSIASGSVAIDIDGTNHIRVRNTAGGGWTAHLFSSGVVVELTSTPGINSQVNPFGVSTTNSLAGTSASLNPGGVTVNGVGGIDATVNYDKAGGGTGTLTFKGGVLTGSV